jgi:hypothetical protein
MRGTIRLHASTSLLLIHRPVAAGAGRGVVAAPPTSARACPGDGGRVADACAGAGDEGADVEGGRYDGDGACGPRGRGTHHAGAI